MPPGGSKPTAKNASPPGATIHGVDWISALPDAVLQHALGFLPAREAVRTSVLAGRWRHLWRFLPHLRVTDAEALGSAKKLKAMVSQLLLLRDSGLALDECVFNLPGFEGADTLKVDRWIRHALLLRARVLCLSTQESIVLKDRRLVSQYLRTLHLSGVELFYDILDFSSCPALVDLEITSSFTYTHEIRSPSSKCMSIVNCSFLGSSVRIRISAPSLIWLKLEYCDGLTPFLENMPSLETASMRFGCENEDLCEEDCSADCCGECFRCHDDGVRIDGCVLLGGLSNATNLNFRASFGMFTFKKDLARCPTFHKLKNLCLTDWCLAGDLHALLGFLQHTPNLEKLNLQLCQKEKCALETGGSNAIEQSFSLGQLKIVEIKCEKIDERVQKTLKILSKIGICLEQFNIQKI
uniref:F-box domain-containing protein n=1 Tax=Arundo donax TaxID=35708 RepID=A0A0A9BSV5_ARUDO